MWKCKFTLKKILIIFSATCIIASLLSAVLLTAGALSRELDDFFYASDNLAELIPPSHASMSQNSTSWNNDFMQSVDTIEAVLTTATTTRDSITWTNFVATFDNLNYSYHIVASNLNKENSCNNFTNVFIMVPSRSDAFDRRTNIRNSWAQLELIKSLNMVIRFVVGLTRDPLVLDMLLSEQRATGDLIINDIPDVYENLFLKIYSGFQWQQAFCNETRYILKTDDDSVVDLERLSYWIDKKYALHILENNSTIFGHIWHGTKPIRKRQHKWYVPKELFFPEIYPDYANGATYFMSNVAVNAILKNAPGVKAFLIEDVLFTGVLADVAHITRCQVDKHFRAGSVLYHKERCNKEAIPYVTAVYGLKAQQIPKAYRLLRDVPCRR